ncbi:MAG: OmpA family protein [Hyphomonadaceae bacterium]
MKRILVLTASALAVTACATDPLTGQPIYGRTATGAAIGAIVGGIGGVFAGGNDGRNAAVGAAVGALAGGAIGRYMDGQEEDLKRKTMESGIGLQRVGDTIQLVMPADITFAQGSAALSPSFTPWLDKVAESLNQYPQTTIDIVGYASTEGSEQTNLTLSLQRANAVRDYLASRGVNNVDGKRVERMATGGVGEAREGLVVYPDDTEAKRAQNRRVTITLRPVV